VFRGVPRIGGTEMDSRNLLLELFTARKISLEEKEALSKLEAVPVCFERFENNNRGANLLILTLNSFGLVRKLIEKINTFAFFAYKIENESGTDFLENEAKMFRLFSENILSDLNEIKNTIDCSLSFKMSESED
jgi:hypothetical protein